MVDERLSVIIPSERGNPNDSLGHSHQGEFKKGVLKKKAYAETPN
jgi:hypothetical protein